MGVTQVIKGGREGTEEGEGELDGRINEVERAEGMLLLSVLLLS